MKRIAIGTVLALSWLTTGCAIDDDRLVGRWTLVNELSCPDYTAVEPTQPISMLRFNQNGDWALSYEDGQLIFRGNYLATPEADGASDFSAKLELNVEKGPADLSPYRLTGNYSVQENYLTLHDIWLSDKAKVSGCGYYFKRR